MPEINLKFDENNQLAPDETDDQTANYLLSRQVAHEFYHPAMQELIKSDRAAELVRQQAIQTEQETFRKEQTKKSAEGKAAESTFAESMVQGLRGRQNTQAAHGEPAPTTLTETVPAHTTGSEKAAIGTETQGLEQPMIDPTQAFGAGFGASIARASMNTLMPSLARATAAGIVNMATDVPIGMATDVVGASIPELALPTAVVLGLFSGATIEPILERGIVKAASMVGKVLSPEEIKVQTQLFRGLLANEVGAVGQIDDLTKRVVAEELNTEINNAPVSQVRKTMSGIPTPPDMKKAAGEFTANRNPDITTSYAGEKSGGNIRIWSEDLQPKFLSDIESPEDIDRLLTSTQETFAAQKETAARGVQSWGMTEEAAKKYGITDLLGRKAGQSFNAEQIEAGRQMLVTSAASLKGMADAVRGGMANDLQKMEFMRAFNVHYAIQMQMSGIAAEAGRALQIFRKTAASSDLRMGQLKDFMQAIPGGVSPEFIADRLSTMDNPGKVSAFVKQAKKATTVDMWNESYINGMLWLPTTHMANTASNFITDVMSIGERYIAAGISKSPIGSGEINTKEAQYYAYGMMQGSTDFFRILGRGIVSGEPSDQMSKLELSGIGRKAITAENVAANLKKIPVIGKLAPQEFAEGSFLKQGIDAMGEVVRTPGRFLMAEDDAFKAMAYRAELNAQSMRKATQEFNGQADASKVYLEKAGIDVSGMNDEQMVKKAMSNRMAEIVSDPQTHAPDVYLGAKEHARYLTFTSPIKNLIVQAIRGSQNPFMKMLVPFTGTPYNVFRYATERTPGFGFALKSMREDFEAGGARRDMALAKQAIGTMVWGAAVGMTMAGMVNGYGPRDPNVRKAWLRDGHKPYSFNVGDTVVEYGRLEPFSSVFGVAADASEIVGLADPKLAPETDKIFPAFMASTSQNYMSKTFMQGISQGINAAYEADVNKMEKLMQSVAKTSVPFSSALRGVEQIMSPERKSVDTVMDAIRSEIPGLSDTLPKQRDLWGRTLSKEIEKGESYLQTAYRTISPIYISKRTDSPIDKELYNLKRGLPMPAHDQSFASDMGGKPQPFELNPAQYEKLLIYMNDTPLDSTGSKLKPSLDQLVRSSDYKDLKDKDEKIDMIRDHLREAKIMGLRKLYETDAVIRQTVDILAQDSLNAQ